MFATPLGLLALAALPAVAWLHLYRRRSQPRVVSALFLWPVDEALAQAGRKRERLHSDLSFWCELAAALCLALALAGPRGCAREGQHLVAVIDTSASMAAVDSNGQSAMDRVRADLSARIAELPSGSRVTLIASGNPPRVSAGPAALPAEALAQLENERPGLRSHGLGAAVELALELAAGGEVLLLGDQLEPDRWPPSVSTMSHGQAAPNLALAGARRIRTMEGERLELSVENFSGAERDLELIFRDDLGSEFGRESLSLQSEERRSWGLRLTSPRPIHVQLAASGGNALALDDEAFLPPSPPRTVRLYSDLPSELGLGLGIAGDAQSPTSAWADLARDARSVENLAEADLAITQTALPDNQPGGAWALTLGPTEGETQAWIGPFLIDRSAPALTGLSLEGVVWTAGPGSLPGVPLIAAGTEALFSESIARDGRRIWRANLDPARSSLHRSPDWPILLHNLVEARRAELPGPVETQLVVGEALVLRATAPATYRLAGPEQSDELEADRDVVRTDLGRTGWYTLSRTSEPQASWTYGVSFVDARESDLRGLSGGEQIGDAGRARIEAGVDTWQVLALLAALALFCLDWAWLARGRRASSPGEGGRP